MAEAHHYKLSRKALREPDEFQHVTSEVLDWLRTNQSAVVGALSTIVAIAAVVLGVNWWAARQADAAGVRLQSAQASFESKKYHEAEAEFAAVATTYPRTPAGRIALLYRGHALAAQPDPVAAGAAYAEYLATSPDADYLRQEALLGLARAKEAARDTAAATDAYRQAADVPGPFKTQAQLALARLEDGAGNAERARALYAEVLSAPDLDPETRQWIKARVPGAVVPTKDARADER